MKIIVRSSLFLFALSMGSLAACGGSDDSTAAASPSAGAGGSAAGSGGTGTAGTGGTSAGAGGTSAGAGGTSAGAGGSSAGAGGTSAGAAGTSAGGSASGNKMIKAAEGGTITADGFMLEIPPGALMADTEITIAVGDGATAPAATLVGKVYDLGPNGTMFTKPVKFTIDVDAAKLGAKNPVVSYVDAGKWVALKDSVGAGGKVTATATHFTVFGVLGSDAMACVAMAKADCQSCCKTTFAKGSGEPVQFAIEFCGCAADAPCLAQCSATLCKGMTPPTECLTCMMAAGSGTPETPCFLKAAQACLASPDCQSASSCSNACK